MSQGSGRMKAAPRVVEHPRSLTRSSGSSREGLGMKPTPIMELSEATARSVRERIARRTVVTDSGCWDWVGAKDRWGYGKFKIADGGVTRCTGSHRAAWLAFRGPISDPALQIDHLCRNRSCANPEHLDLVNNQTNSLRSIAAAGPGGRGRPRGDACERAGHERTQENTYSYWDRNGYLHSQCTICRREQQRARRLANKLAQRAPHA